MDIRKKIYSKRVMKPWNKLAWKVEESPTLEGFKTCIDLVLKDMV